MRVIMGVALGLGILCCAAEASRVTHRKLTEAVANGATGQPNGWWQSCGQRSSSGGSSNVTAAPQPKQLTQQQTQPVESQQQSSPAPAAAQSVDVYPAGKQAYCIPATKGAPFNVLMAGDSLTMGAVPSSCVPYPCTIKLTQLLQARLGDKANAVSAGLPGSGIYVTGRLCQYCAPTTFGPFLQDELKHAGGPWNVVVIMIGINDLGTGHRSADEVMAGLQPLVTGVLNTGVPVFVIPPLPAPGNTGSQEAERRKLACLIINAATQWANSTKGAGPQMYAVDLQSGPMDFDKMSIAEQAAWLDDGLHLTPYGYDQLGQYVYDAIASRLC